MRLAFSNFSSSLLLNYWNADRDPILNEFLKENIPFILSENTGYIANSSVPYNEEDIEKQVKSISFKDHPYFKSNYKTVSFSLLLKMLNNNCIGYYSAQVSFCYESNTDLNIALTQLKNQFSDFPNTSIILAFDQIFNIKTTDDYSWPSSIYLKTVKQSPTEHILIFSATDLFF
ncbi:hypothetical protein [Sediminibacterium sp.]|uniref:hypothetical protein n=1 Tax=Sediminibacterium sp. TaxID=1917865 RepID=UPI003F725EA0